MSESNPAVGRQTAIGAFVLGGAVLVLAAIVLFGKTHIFSPTLQAAVVFQDSISGLIVGAPVTFRGVRVGSVAGIAVVYDGKTQAAYIPVTLELEPGRVVLTDNKKDKAVDLTTLTARGLRAELVVQSFVTGQSEIDLDFDAASPAVLHPGITQLPEIPTQQSTIQKMQEQLSKLPLHELADNANATLQSLRALSEKLDQSLPPLITSLRATSDRSAEAIVLASKSVTELQGRLDGTLGDISRLANTGTALLSDRGAELHTVLLSSNQTVLQAREVLADLKGFTSERGADRANIDSALRDLATAAAALRGLASEVEHNPQLLLTGRRP
jgi:paraquat-inducible protein B